MNSLIIYAHPNKESLNYAILQGVETKLKELNVDFKTIDLHEDNFNPVLIFNKDKKRRDLHIEKETEQYRNDIKDAKNIIFVYPLWWDDMPAILKGFIDRVFVLDFAYESNSKFPKGLLTDKSGFIINTMDSPKIYSKYILFDDHFKMFKRSILKFCGFKKIDRYSFYNVKHRKKEDIQNEIPQMLKKLEKFVKE